MLIASLSEKIRHIGAKRLLVPVCATAVWMTGGLVSAQQGPTMEERLRAQLRNTTEQLQQAQNELAVLKSGGRASPGAAASGDAAALQKELDKVRAAEKNAQSRSNQAQKESREADEKSAAQVAQYRQAYDDLLKLARASETERQRLDAQANLQKTAVAQCEIKNTKLYEVGQEVLRAYETMDVASVLASRQPFSAQSRAKFEQIAQQYGDKLYEGKFDARSNAVTPVSDNQFNAVVGEQRVQ